VKVKIVCLAAMALAGLAASYALADKGGRPGHDNAPTGDPACQHAHVHGTLAAPQSLTVTIAKAGKHDPFAPNQVVTVTLGATGQTVDVNAEGCTTDGSTLTAKQAVLHVHPTPPDPPAGPDSEHGHGHHDTTTTTDPTTTGTDTGADTTTNP
jgi:hypothetical protein